jgi:uncharacterized protein (TIGR02270 family)
MSTARATFIADILEEHLEELAILWRQRGAALRSSLYSRQAFDHLEERIEAHVDGLLTGADNALPLLKDQLLAEEAAVVFAAAYTLLRLARQTGAQLVVEALTDAQPAQLEGMGQALCHGPIDLVSAQLRKALEVGPSPVAATAAEVLAFHLQAPVGTSWLEGLLADAQPEVRRVAWRITARLGLAVKQQVIESGFTDKDPQGRATAFAAAAWTRQSFLLPYCRTVAANGKPEGWDAALILAILGKPEDRSVILSLGTNPSLGSKRYQLLSAYGHPNSVEELTREMVSPDARAAVAAGAAFTKITGCDVESDKQVQLAPEDNHEPDEFEKEFLDEAKLPEVQRGQAFWQKNKDRFAKGTRWCRGFDLSHGAKPEILDQLDMESRWETCLRGKFEGTWQGSPIDLERFPQTNRIAGPVG